MSPYKPHGDESHVPMDNEPIDPSKGQAREQAGKRKQGQASKRDDVMRRARRRGVGRRSSNSGRGLGQPSVGAVGMWYGCMHAIYPTGASCPNVHAADHCMPLSILYYLSISLYLYIYVRIFAGNNLLSLKISIKRSLLNMQRMYCYEELE